MKRQHVTRMSSSNLLPLDFVSEAIAIIACICNKLAWLKRPGRQWAVLPFALEFYLITLNIEYGNFCLYLFQSIKKDGSCVTL